MPCALCDKIIVSSLCQIICDDISRHHSPIHSPSKISSGAYFSNTFGDEICFRHPISSTFREKIFISSPPKLIWWRKMSSPYITTLSDDIIHHQKSHSLSHQKNLLAPIFQAYWVVKICFRYQIRLIGDEIRIASPNVNLWEMKLLSSLNSDTKYLYCCSVESTRNKKQ